MKLTIRKLYKSNACIVPNLTILNATRRLIKFPLFNVRRGPGALYFCLSKKAMVQKAPCQT